ncbi:Rap1a/Tai family immunity protein [Sphingosinicella humi]|uniref:Rap1a immunity protein domain-containing protein n=1 Tax=Allosphingosinicella humi TaxID=2068657 RepID=A0A2U2J543_9SPHN|nr:Rap1a/Tai family immunity protein [Sphingosinicella humi]PWG03469.1 hypothetical protein DF286_11755 [Sphingosinicella humi]
MMTPGLALAGLVMAQAASPVPLIPSFFTAQALFDICSRPNAGQCSMYITGTVDGMFLLEAARGRESFCLPQMTNREAADAVVEYLDGNPEVRRKAASAAIYEALTESFPCPESEPAAPVETGSE